MKRYILFACLMMCCVVSKVAAADSLVSLAARQQWEERFRTMNARLEKMEEAIQLYQQRMNKMAEEIYALRQELSRRSNDSTATAAAEKSLRQLADSIKEVDRKRIADYKKLVDALSVLEKGLIKRSTPSRPSISRIPNRGKEKGYAYTVEKGDNAGVIAAKLRQNGVNISAKQIMDANPGVVWTKLQIGQELFIPEP